MTEPKLSGTRALRGAARRMSRAFGRVLAIGVVGLLAGPELIDLYDEQFLR